MLSSDVLSATRRLLGWLSEDALPLWSTIGVDRGDGGFIEQLTSGGQVVADVRRARLVARQIFSFKAAGDLGWNGPVDEIVRHGLLALADQHLTKEGGVVPRFIPAENRGDGAFDLYDQAFVLFGLAHGYAHTGDDALAGTALETLTKMRAEWAQPGGGFAEHRPAQSPLKANPHMHLLEAALAWMAVSSNAAWRTLADEMVGLCLARFIDPTTGSLHEFFDTDWTMICGGPDDVVEPGHQAEWAWLLLRWQSFQPTEGLEGAALRLVEIAESEGLDRNQNRLINGLNADLTPRDSRLRLWPQTERIKALIAFIERENNDQRRKDLEERLAQAVGALLDYFKHPLAGSWWEHFDEQGNPIDEPARASSLYHIMGAANELAHITGDRLG